jgi:hypothetical protein
MEPVSDAFFRVPQHRNTKDNNPELPFKFNEKNQAVIAEILKKYPPQYKKAAVMPLLDLGQRQHGFTSISVMNEVARLLEMPPMRVYEVASFYTMYNRTPVGKFFVQICTTVRLLSYFSTRGLNGTYLGMAIAAPLGCGRIGRFLGSRRIDVIEDPDNREARNQLTISLLDPLPARRLRFRRHRQGHQEPPRHQAGRDYC